MDSRLIFRFDDIGAANRSALGFIDLMETLERPYMLGVIPDALSSRMQRRLRAVRHAAIFQHGATHANHSRAEAPDEFPAEWGKPESPPNCTADAARSKTPWESP